MGLGLLDSHRRPKESSGAPLAQDDDDLGRGGALGLPQVEATAPVLHLDEEAETVQELRSVGVEIRANGLAVAGVHHRQPGSELAGGGALGRRGVSRR